MPSPALAAKITLNGTLGQGEVFSTGFWVSAGVFTTAAAFQAANDAFRTAIATPLASLLVEIDAQAAYTNVRSYYYSTVANQPATFIAQSSITSGTGTGGFQLPLQTCFVASLRSSLLTSAGRGRMYIPGTGASLVNHELGSAAHCTQIATAVKGLMAAASTAFTAGGVTAYPAVYSPTRSLLTPVSSVIVDSRPDIQRRRAQKQTVLFSGTVAVP